MDFKIAFPEMRRKRDFNEIKNVITNNGIISYKDFSPVQIVSHYLVRMTS